MFERDVYLGGDTPVGATEANKTVDDIMKVLRGKGFDIEGAVTLLDQAKFEITKRTPV